MNTELMFKISNEMFKVLNDKQLTSDQKKLHIYTTYGFTENAKMDRNWRIRREAYRVLGYPIIALKDANPYIRLEAAVSLNLIDDYNESYVNSKLLEAV